MGLRPWVLSASWAVTYLLLLALVAALSVAVLTSSFLAGTSPSLLLAYFGAFALSEVAFGLLVATLFGSAKAAAVVGPLAHFAAVMPRYVFVKTGGQAGGSRVCLTLHAGWCWMGGGFGVVASLCGCMRQGACCACSCLQPAALCFYQHLPVKGCWAASSPPPCVHVRHPLHQRHPLLCTL
jgi:hypothetical protein